MRHKSPKWPRWQQWRVHWYQLLHDREELHQLLLPMVHRREWQLERVPGDEQLRLGDVKLRHLECRDRELRWQLGRALTLGR